MTSAAQTLDILAPAASRDRPRIEPRIIACAAFDAVAAGILLFGTALPPSLEVATAAALHAIAVLSLLGMRHVRSSERWLCTSAVLAVPFVGAAVAIAVLNTTGRGTITLECRRIARRRPSMGPATMRRLRGALSPCDALECGNEEQQRIALTALSLRSDPEAIALLRRVAAGGDPDLALSAALTLDEIGERSERVAMRREPAEVRNATG